MLTELVLRCLGSFSELYNEATTSEFVTSSCLVAKDMASGCWKPVCNLIGHFLSTVNRSCRLNRYYMSYYCHFHSTPAPPFGTSSKVRIYSPPSNPCKDVLNYIINDNSSRTNMEPSLHDTFSIPSNVPLGLLILD